MHALNKSQAGVCACLLTTSCCCCCLCRFRCAAGGKLILSKSCGRAGSAAFASKSARPHQQVGL